MAELSKVDRSGTSVFDKLTLDDFLAYEETQRIKMIKSINEINRKLNRDLLQSISKYEAELASKGVTLTDKERRKLFEKAQAEQNKQELEALKKYYKEVGVLNEKQAKREEKNLEKQKEFYEEIKKLQDQAEEARKRNNEEEAKLLEKKISKKLEAQDNATAIGDAVGKAFSSGNLTKRLGAGIDKLDNAINQAISTYASYQQSINARLQGIEAGTIDVWKGMNKTLQAVAYSPLYKTEELYSNLATLVEEGIAANVEQRAFLQTVSKGIARTFDANDSSLRRMIRLQQYDSTAARLGMESYLTKFMNELVKNTEYLNSTFDNVTASLMEASSLLGSGQAGAQASTEFEYTVQKWLGTLTGVGLSENTAQSLAQAIGYLGSGNISALNSSAMQNLLVMAASRNPNIDIASLLSGGVSATQANQLLGSVVGYLQEIGSTASNNVVLSEMANIFGVSVSDLVAARNLRPEDTRALLGNMLSYSGMYDTLSEGMRNYAKVTGVQGILENLFGNFTYGQGMNIASSPALYSMWKITDLIQGVTGGINIPAISVMGNMVDLNTTVENLIKLGIVGISTLGGIGKIVSGVGSAFGGGLAENLLTKMNIGAYNERNVIQRGTGLEAKTSGLETSVTTFVGNVEGEDYSSSALSSAQDEAKKKQASESEDMDNPTEDIRDTLSKDGDFYMLVEGIRENLLTLSAVMTPTGGTLVGPTTYTGGR